jgi:hypothetical protein
MSTTTFYNSQNLVGIGSVGIGTTNPGTNIVAINSATNPGNAGIAQFLAPNITSGSQARICLGQRGGTDSATSSDGAYIDYTNYSSAGSSKNTFSIGFTGAAVDVFFVQSSGNVGMGTTNPLYSLHTTGDILTGGGIRWNTGGVNPADKKLYSGADGDLEWYTNSTAGAHGFAVSNQGTKVVYLNTSGYSYFNGGNVGIGRTDPLYKFNVDNGSTAGPTALFQASSLGNAVKTSVIIGKTNANNNSGTIVWNHQADADATNYLGLGCWNTDNTLNITAAARVGIGITNPTSYTLQVFGTTGCSGDIIAYYSDDRLKTRTGKLENALVKVCSLDTFTYVTNDLAKSFGFDDDCQRVGLSAQQVQKVLPEAVKRAPFDAEKVDGVERSKTGQNYLTVQYEKIVPLLVEALKEEKSKREALEGELEVARRDHRSLEERVIQMQALLSKVLETVGFPS